MNIRCVVTGRDPAGKSVIARDERVEPKTVLGFEFHRLWGSDAPATLPVDGKAPVPPRYFPAGGGFRFGYCTIPPHSDDIAPQDFMAALPDAQQKLPGLFEVLEPEHPGMHTTQTVDFDVVLSGEMWLELDDGKEVLLQAGDCVVQNGTRHAWHNRSSEPCVFAVCLIAAKKT